MLAAYHCGAPPLRWVTADWGFPSRKRHGFAVMIADRGVAQGILTQSARLNKLFDPSLGIRITRPCTPAEVVPSYPRSYRGKALRHFNEGRTSDVLSALSLQEDCKDP
jgi:hypothetical protein